MLTTSLRCPPLRSSRTMRTWWRTGLDVRANQERARTALTDEASMAEDDDDDCAALKRLEVFYCASRELVDELE